MAQKISVLTPLAYIIVMISSLVIFSTIYRKNKIRKLTTFKPVYEQTFARDNYFALKEIPNVDKKLLRCALIRWAGEDIRQIVKMKQAKEILNALHQKGSLGDSTYQKFMTNEKIIEAELQMIGAEANEMHPNWGNNIFKTATEVAQVDGLRTRVAESEVVKKEYEETLANIRQRALVDLNED